MTRDTVKRLLTLLVVLLASASASGVAAEGRPVVVLLHGLARTAASMDDMAVALEAAGYRVCNTGYPSRNFPVEELATRHVLVDIQAWIGAETGPINFVTHSMGGILVRQLRAAQAPLVFGRVVMLGPPNGGSEVVDKLGGLPPFAWINGPAGLQLGTQAGSVPRALGPIDVELGVIAGKNSINPVLSWLIPGEDDGKVSINNARLAGMKDFIVVEASHPFLASDPVVIEQAIHFLQAGHFRHAAPPRADDLRR